MQQILTTTIQNNTLEPNRIIMQPEDTVWDRYEAKIKSIKKVSPKLTKEAVSWARGKGKK